MAAPSQTPDEDTELVNVLSGIPFTDPAYGSWWNSPEGQWLYSRIETRIGTPVTGCINRQYGVSYEAADLANSAFTLLRQPFISAYVLRSEEPWAYLAQVLKRDLVQQAGAYFRVELTDSAILQAVPGHEAAPDLGVHEASTLTAGVLAPLAPQIPVADLTEAVLYFAERGHVRLSHLYTAATNDPELTGLGLDRNEVLAIANAVLGSRPDHAHNSLLTGYLTDSEFDPSSSLMHRRALNKFASRMKAAAKPMEVALVG